MKHIFSILFLLTLSVSIQAQQHLIDGIYYEINPYNRTARVVKSPELYKGYITIPSSIDYYGTEYTVTTIDNYAFRYCTELIYVELPETVTFIGGSVFEGCTSLLRVIIPETVTYIGGCAFMNCSSLPTIHLPTGLEQIGDCMFYGCKSLTSIIIPNKVTEIYDGAFGNSGLSFVYIPKDVISLVETAFNGCTNLGSISVDSANPMYDSRDGCNAIIRTQDNALVVGCYNTRIPESVKIIGIRSFADCANLKSITIPKSVQSISYNAFRGCYALRSVYCLNPSPPELDTNVFPSELKPWSLPAKAQQQDDGKCRLYVPAGSGSQYARKWQWPNNLVEEVQDMDFITGIDGATINNPVMPTAYYNELGQPLTEPKKGLVIVRYSDGTTRKIMVK